MQDRFGKAPDVIRSISDEDEGLCFEWAPAGMPLPDSPGSAGVVALAGPYMPLQGSLLPDAESESMPMQAQPAQKCGSSLKGFHMANSDSGAIGDIPCRISLAMCVDDANMAGPPMLPVLAGPPCLARILPHSKPTAQQCAAFA